MSPFWEDPWFKIRIVSWDIEKRFETAYRQRNCGSQGKILRSRKAGSTEALEFSSIQKIFLGCSSVTADKIRRFVMCDRRICFSLFGRVPLPRDGRTVNTTTTRSFFFCSHAASRNSFACKPVYHGEIRVEPPHHITLSTDSTVLLHHPRIIGCSSLQPQHTRHPESACRSGLLTTTHPNEAITNLECRTRRLRSSQAPTCPFPEGYRSRQSAV